MAREKLERLRFGFLDSGMAPLYASLGPESKRKNPGAGPWIAGSPLSVRHAEQWRL